MRTLRLTCAFLTLAALYLLAVAFLLSRPAQAHTAPSGWSYDLACCSTQDCAPIRAELVKITAEGYRVTVSPGDHPLVTVPTTYVFPFSDERVRLAPDGMYHLCIGAYSKRGLCLYAPGFTG